MTFAAALVEDILALEVGPDVPSDPAATRDWVTERLAGAGQVTRLGLAVAAGAVAAAVRVRHGRPYAALDVERRRAIARRLLDTRLPLAGDYARALRALAITHAFEAG